MSDSLTNDAIEKTTEIVAAYVANNSLPMADLPTFIRSVHTAVDLISTGKIDMAPVVDRKEPAVPIKRSITQGYLISLEDGQKFKSLKRHLMASYGMTPDDYRTKWGLPKDYPMVAPSYASRRSALAKSVGLGRKRPAGKAPAELE